jgi:glycosyltransferase involved in cell wall biosynthesis
MKAEPKVSVVLTSFNQQLKLKRAFESLISQTYKNLEIIIVDDCSTDGKSHKYIFDITGKNQNVSYFIQEMNVGIAKNKNTGFKIAKGDYVTYLDGDDYYLPTKIEREVAVLREDSSVDVVFSNFRLEDEFGKILGVWKQGGDVVPEGEVFKEVITRSYPKGTLFRFELMKREVLKDINYYDEEIVAFHDWDSRVRYSKTCKIKFTDNIGSVYVQDPKGISKIQTGDFLLNEMKCVVSKNLHLLKDLAQEEKREVESKLNDLFLKKELYLQESIPLFLKESIKYFKKNPGDFGFIVNQLVRKSRRYASWILK